MRKKIRVLLISGFIIFFGWVTYEVLEMIFWEYHDISIVDTTLKNYLLNDSLRNNIVTQICKTNSRDDTILCFTYKNEIMITCLKLNKYSALEVSNITQGAPVVLDFEQSKAYFMFSGGEFCPIYMSVKQKISSTNMLSYVFNECDTIYYNVRQEDGIFVEVKCSNLGILDKNQTPDVIFESAYPNNKATFIILKTQRGVFVFYGYNTANSENDQIEPVSLLNNHSFPMLTHIRD
jgi:hypothetical protein